jgi:hypothetical protein
MQGGVEGNTWGPKRMDLGPPIWPCKLLGPNDPRSLRYSPLLVPQKSQKGACFGVQKMEHVQLSPNERKLLGT